jgi:hypothetical protein
VEVADDATAARDSSEHSTALAEALTDAAASRRSSAAVQRFQRIDMGKIVPCATRGALHRTRFRIDEADPHLRSIKLRRSTALRQTTATCRPPSAFAGKLGPRPDFRPPPARAASRMSSLAPA